MIQPLADFRARLSSHERDALDSCHILTSAIRGFALSMVVPAAASPIKPSGAPSGAPSSLTLVSRLSCRRAGTRFNARGIDDEGNVANFVETETVFWTPPSVDGGGCCFAYAQVRGSVPVFWEQAAGLLPGQQKIHVTRSAEATQPAFDRHFEELARKYGAVHILNLLSETKAGEVDLTNRYRYHVRNCSLRGGSGAAGDGGVGGAKGAADDGLLRETEYDFHAQTRTGYEAAEMIKHHIQVSAEGFAYFLADVDRINQHASRGVTRPPMPMDARTSSVVILQQEGVFRTNCLDCLDRTNVIQTMISRIVLEAFLEQSKARAASDFWARHSSLWADNGDVSAAPPPLSFLSSSALLTPCRPKKRAKINMPCTSAPVPVKNLRRHGRPQNVLYPARQDVAGGRHCRCAQKCHAYIHQ
jgi:hypothetical protein